MSRKKKRWSYTAGHRPHTVAVEEFEVGSNIYVRIWDKVEQKHRYRSLRHRDKKKAKEWADRMVAKAIARKRVAKERAIADKVVARRIAKEKGQARAAEARCRAADKATEKARMVVDLNARRKVAARRKKQAEAQRRAAEAANAKAGLS